jgi:hypothetical protein
MVKKAEAVQSEMNESGKFDQYEIYVVYSDTMAQATDVLDDLEWQVQNDCGSIPYKASRDKTIDAEWPTSSLWRSSQARPAGSHNPGTLMRQASPKPGGGRRGAEEQHTGSTDL